MSRQIEIRYIVIKGSGHVLTETFPLGDIENGRVITWLKANNASDDNCEIHSSQFTGRHDTNGKAICEGDCLRVSNDWGLGPQPVWWNTKTSSWNVGPQWFLGALCDRNTVEVIGNIHENPELIKS